MVTFSFLGRFTLREINGVWYIYDRETQTTTKEAGHTFKSAKDFLIKYKLEQNDKGV